MLYTIENAFLRAQISDVGAELQSLVRMDNGEEYVWQGDPAVWSGRSPLLFPIVGRLKDDCYRYAGKKYDMPKHGFAIDSVFAVAEQKADSVCFVLESGAHKDGYPFDFRLSLHFALEGECLRITHRVENTGADTMYFSLGAHPAFICRMGDFLYFPEDESARAYRLTEDKLLTDETVEQPVVDHKLVVTPEIFQDDALIFAGLRSDSATLTTEKGPRVTVDFGNAPCLGVWAKPGAPYVCIEPWYGIDDSAQVSGILAEKPYINRLEPGCCFRFPVRICPHA